MRPSDTMDWLLNESLVQLIGMSSRKSQTSCGYCKQLTNSTEEDSTNDDEETSNSSSEMNSEERRSVCLGIGGIRVYTEHVQALVDIGWNWSGRYLYKPIMEKTCCPLYTIRLDADAVQLTRSQKRVLRVWYEFLKDDKRPAVRGNVASRVSSTPLQPPTKLKKQANPTTTKTDKSRKKKTQRVERALERLRSKNIDIQEYQKRRREKEKNRQRTLESYLVDFGPSFKHKLEVRTVRVGSAEFEASEKESFAVYQKYQQIVHDDHRCSQRGFRSFLVDSPFLASDPGNQEGSYHQQYLIDGRIIAVGVVDLLPYCLSSAYFYYDPDYAFLNLGTYSALREIAFVREVSKTHPQCHYYYMGYYVHACRKMRYKGSFRPSELLCERSHEWVPLPECIDMIEKNDGRFTVFRPLSPPASMGNEWNCRPLKYYSENAHFERVTVNDEVAKILTKFAKYFGPLCHEVYVVI
ncbi:Arginyl-tRNA--protein transferase 1 [Aphelenchoides besseyi]|nr:Arginyl-tRNA--protein transferase 1 [Aphelenchoides besseyi]